LSELALDQVGELLKVDHPVPVGVEHGPHLLNVPARGVCVCAVCQSVCAVCARA
jgi:hypothetical protein